MFHSIYIYIYTYIKRENVVVVVYEFRNQHPNQASVMKASNIRIFSSATATAAAAPLILLVVVTLLAVLSTPLYAEKADQRVTVDTLAQQHHRAVDDHDNNAIISRFQSYLRINTMQPQPDYASAVEYLRGEAQRIGLDFQVVELVQGKPIVVMTWRGAWHDSEKSILFNSHMDIVPADLDKWTRDPLGAEEDPETGNIYARGSQDMKCVGMQYLEAIDRLKNVQKLDNKGRTVHVSFVPDEEIGAKDGMKAFVKSDQFRALNVGFGVDEGLASGANVDSIPLYYGERVSIWALVTARGPVGHGSAFVPNTSTEIIAQFIQRVFEFRRQQELDMRIKKRGSGDQVTINLTSMRAGHTNDCGKSFSMNVIPTEATVGLDIRIPPTVSTQTMIDLLDEWTSKSSDQLSYEVINIDWQNPMTNLDTNKYFQVFQQALAEKMNVTLDHKIFPAATDARFVRNEGIDVIGFSPMPNTPVLLHDHDEYLNRDVYLRGIDMYVTAIDALVHHVPRDNNE